MNAHNRPAAGLAKAVSRNGWGMGINTASGRHLDRIVEGFAFGGGGRSPGGLELGDLFSRSRKLRRTWSRRWSPWVPLFRRPARKQCLALYELWRAIRSRATIATVLEEKPGADAGAR